jgi:hypothetical protein
MTELSEVFWMTVLGTSAGIIGLIIKKMSASKCDDISCFGIRIHRRVELETNIDEESASEQKKPTSYSL